jgi:hypothetical protein
MRTLDSVIRDLKAMKPDSDQVSVKRPEQPINPMWESLKIWIDSQSTNAAHVISENPEAVKFSIVGKFNRIQVNLGSVHGFPVEFVVYEPIAEGTQRGFYAGFDDKTKMCYMRNISDQVVGSVGGVW